MKKVINILKKRIDVLIDEYETSNDKLAFLNNKDFMVEVENFTVEQSTELLTKMLPLTLKQEGANTIALSIPLLALIIVKNLYVQESLKNLFNAMTPLKKTLVLMRFLEDGENIQVQSFIRFWLSRLSSKDVMECKRRNELFNQLLNLKDNHFYYPFRANFFVSVWLSNNFLEKLEENKELNKKIMALLLKENKLQDQNGRLRVLENLNPLSQFNLIPTMLEFLEKPEVFEYLNTFSHIPAIHLEKIEESWIDSYEKMNFISKFQGSEVYLSKYILDNYLDKSFVVAYFLDGFQTLMKDKVNAEWQNYLKESPKFVKAVTEKLTLPAPDSLKNQFLEALGAYNMSKLYRLESRDYEDEEKHWAHSVENFYDLDTHYKNLVIEFRQSRTEENALDQLAMQIKLHKYFSKLCFDAHFYQNHENLANLKYFNAYIINLLENTDNQVEHVLNYLYNDDFREFLKLSPCHFLIWTEDNDFYCDSFIGHNMFITPPKKFANYLDILETFKVLEGITQEEFIKYLVFLYFLNEKDEKNNWQNITLTHESPNGNLSNNIFEKLRKNYLLNDSLRKTIEFEEKTKNKKTREAAFMKKNYLRKGEQWLSPSEQT